MREECIVGTHVKIFQDITKWANDSSSGSPHVFWLTGQACSGKNDDCIYNSQMIGWQLSLLATIQRNAGTDSAHPHHRLPALINANPMQTPCIMLKISTQSIMTSPRVHPVQHTSLTLMLSVR